MSFRALTSRTAALSLALTGVVFAAASPPPDKGPDAAWKKDIAAAVQAVMAKNLPAAEQSFQQAVQVAEQFGPNDARQGTTLNNLGLVLKEEKKYADAERTFGKALDVLQRIYGPDSIDVANVSFNVASVLLSQGAYDRAIPYILRSRAIYEKTLGKDSQKTAATLCMAGDAYRNLKKYADAEGALKQCADLREAAGGVDNAELADALFSLGLVYVNEGKYALADARLKLAEKIRELTLGVTSPEFADVLEAHASLLKSMGRSDEASRDEKMAAAVRRNSKKTQ